MRVRNQKYPQLTNSVWGKEKLKVRFLTWDELGVIGRLFSQLKERGEGNCHFFCCVLLSAPSLSVLYFFAPPQPAVQAQFFPNS